MKQESIGLTGSSPMGTTKLLIMKELMLKSVTELLERAELLKSFVEELPEDSDFFIQTQISVLLTDIQLLARKMPS